LIDFCYQFDSANYPGIHSIVLEVVDIGVLAPFAALVQQVAGNLSVAAVAVYTVVLAVVADSWWQRHTMGFDSDIEDSNEGGRLLGLPCK